MERLYRRRSKPGAVISHELGKTICALSRETGRQIGLLVDRRGRVDMVIAGSAGEIVIPPLGRARAGAGRLRGLRLVHTHLRNEPLTRDDLTDLVMLRLDMVTAIGVNEKGESADIFSAHIDPAPGAEPAWICLEPSPMVNSELSFPDIVREIESELSSAKNGMAKGGVTRAMLVHFSALPGAKAQARMDELEQLAATESINAVDRVIYTDAGTSASLPGSGRVKELVIRAMSRQADMILFDRELSPAQSRRLAGITDIPVMDRTQLILEIFARRAFSKDGKLKVELARLKYTLPRLGYRDDSLSRIRGGIGGRGPGETTLEVSRRRVKDRIRNIRGRLDKLKRGREERRKRRKRSGAHQVAVIGYTNAGKSTLLNALTKSNTLVEDKLFSTLDPSARRIRFPRNMEIIFSDTVGFIQDMPEELMEAFSSTLEELGDADLLLHLVDIGAPDFQQAENTVERVLAQLGMDKIPRLLVYNKTDLLDPETNANESARSGAIMISAVKREGLDRLVSEIGKELARIIGERTRRRGKHA